MSLPQGSRVTPGTMRCLQIRATIPTATVLRQNHGNCSARTPRFIRNAGQLVRLSQRKTQWHDGWYYVRKTLLGHDSTNALATFVLRWLFRQSFWSPKLQNEPTSANVFTTSEIDTFNRLLAKEMRGTTYSGPLTLRGNPFSLQTAWPDTPPLFRFLFGCLASGLEFWKGESAALLEPVFL